MQSPGRRRKKRKEPSSESTVTDEGEKITLDDFLIDVTITLGVSQVQLENGYYMVDLPALLKAKRKHDAADRLNDVLMLIATGGRSMEEAEYKKFIAGLNKEVGVKQATKFDRSKFEELRAMTNMGGNKAR